MLGDFAPVSLLASTNSVVTVHPSLPVRNVRELVALVRAKPGALNYGSAGIGTNPHICGELLNHLARINIIAVQFKGGAPARMATIAGEIPITFNSVLGTAPQVKAGRLRAIGVTSLTRSRVLPDVPTVDESGVPGYEFVAWHGLFTQKAVPAQIVTSLQAKLKAAISPELARQLDDQGLDLAMSPPDAFAVFLKAELAKWGKVVKERGMRAD